jgi:hypothetical protein
LNDEKADRALLEVADEILLNGRRRTRQTQAMHDGGATGMGDGRRLAREHDSQGNFVSYADSFAELEKKQAELVAEVEKKQAELAAEVRKAGLQEKSDAKKIKRLSDSAESLKSGMEKVR